MPDRTIKQGDNWQPIWFTLFAATGAQVTPTWLDLTNASSVTIVMKSGPILTTGSCAIASAVGGRGRYDQSPTEMATPGSFDVEWEVLWNNGKTETVPNTGTRQLLVEDDLRP